MCFGTATPPKSTNRGPGEACVGGWVQVDRPIHVEADRQTRQLTQLGPERAEGDLAGEAPDGGEEHDLLTARPKELVVDRRHARDEGAVHHEVVRDPLRGDERELVGIEPQGERVASELLTEMDPIELDHEPNLSANFGLYLIGIQGFQKGEDIEGDLRVDVAHRRARPEEEHRVHGALGRDLAEPSRGVAGTADARRPELDPAPSRELPLFDREVVNAFTWVCRDDELHACGETSQPLDELREGRVGTQDEHAPRRGLGP